MPIVNDFGRIDLHALWRYPQFYWQAIVSEEPIAFTKIASSLRSPVVAALALTGLGSSEPVAVR